MTKKERIPIIVGNWKMYKTIEEAFSFVDKIVPLLEKESSKVYLAVPYTALNPMKEKLEGTNIVLGAQNMNDAQEGAFTGEVAATMIKEAGASFVLLGHSERRRYFNESNEFINRKVLRADEADIEIILCIGETYEDREAGKTEEVLSKQLTTCLQGVKKPNLMIAYEPVWAIGTGKAATAQIAEEAHIAIKNILSTIFTEKQAKATPVLYGGSVTPENAKEFLKEPNIDGLLVGSCSLYPDSFAKIATLS